MHVGIDQLRLESKNFYHVETDYYDEQNYSYTNQ